MQDRFLNKDKIFIQTTKFADILAKSNGYTDFDNKVIEYKIEYDSKKVYEIAQSSFIDFNNHLFENINEMHSISSGIYLEKSLITFRIFIWGSKGECYEIFKHVLIGEEIKSIDNIEMIKEYIYKQLLNLEQGIIKTYGEDINKSLENFGQSIESRRLPLQSILQFISIQNNINDFI